MMAAGEIGVHSTGSALDCVRLNLGGCAWELQSFADRLRMHIDRSTAEFVIPREGDPDVTVDVHWADELLEAGTPSFDAGSWRAYETPSGFQFDFFTRLLGPQTYKRAIFDAQFRTGRVLLSRPLLGKLEAYYPFEYPLDEVVSMHRLARGAGVELHSCGLRAADGWGYLFVGHSGAGKSTLGKQWVKQRQADILSDDRVVVTADDSGYWIHGTPWHGEAGLAKNATARLQGIFLIQHGARNETEQVPISQAAAELFSRAFVPWYRAQDLDFTLSFLQQLTSKVPVYVFRCLADGSAVEYLERHHAI